MRALTTVAAGLLLAAAIPLVAHHSLDAEFDRTTDADGLVEFAPQTGNVYLIVAHHLEPGESGEGYESTKYSATLTVFVPEFCPCCLE